MMLKRLTVFEFQHSDRFLLSQNTRLRRLDLGKREATSSGETPEDAIVQSNCLAKPPPFLNQAREKLFLGGGDKHIAFTKKWRQGRKKISHPHFLRSLHGIQGAFRTAGLFIIQCVDVVF